MADDDKEGIKEELSAIVGDHLEPDEITLVKVKMKSKEEQTPHVVVNIAPAKKEKEVVRVVKQPVVKVEQKKVSRANTFEHMVEQKVQDNRALFKRKGITLL